MHWTAGEGYSFAIGFFLGLGLMAYLDQNYLWVFIIIVIVLSLLVAKNYLSAS